MATVFKRKGHRKGGPYTISWYDAEQEKWRSCTGYTDSDASMKKGQRLEAESADRREGIVNTVREQSLRPIEEHLVEYINHLKGKKKGADYIAQHEARIRRILDDTKTKRLVDLAPGCVETAIKAMTCTRGFEKSGELLADTTRNEYVTSIKGFASWCFNRRKIDHNPMAGLAKISKDRREAVHPRRALSVKEVIALLDASLRRPELEHLTIRTGPKKGQLGAKVRPAVLAEARLLGENRRMAYLVAIWTGLRRTELEELRWKDVLLDAQVPYIQLRAEATKSKRGDVLPLHPQLVDELRAFRPATFAKEDHVLPVVPDMDVIKRDLKFAGVEYGDTEMGFADLHAQRLTLNTMLASNGVASRVRQSQLRHTDPRLTENIYFDKSIFVKPQADVIAQVPHIPCARPAMKTIEIVTMDTENPAQLVHKTSGFEGQNGALTGAEAFVSCDPQSESFVQSTRLQVFDLAWDGKNRQGSAPSGTEPLSQRAKGLEPSTFTLATSTRTPLNPCKIIQLRKRMRPAAALLQQNCTKPIRESLSPTASRMTLPPSWSHGQRSRMKPKPTSSR